MRGPTFEFTGAAHDPATQMSEFSVTSKDLVKLADSEMIKKLMISSDSDLTPEEAVEQFKKAVEENLRTVAILLPPARIKILC